ncbi:MAG: SagB/ThcOx family dehydrogenase [Candidatus Heimdallarchaeota archaeon]|nr:SagB/ThcOx family dehydrogenase [Candidatus Heimdallarchaeota archaeon]
MKDQIGKEFMKKTQYKFTSQSDQSQQHPNPPLQMEYAHKMRIIDLPKPEEIDVKELSLRKAIEERKSVRKYSDQSLSLIELAWLLWTTQGVKEVMKDNYATLRTVPSAGARHAFDTFLLTNNIEGLEPGIYRYLALEHKLQEYIIEEGIADKVVEASYGQKMVKNNAVTFIWVADIYRIFWRYVERAYRYIHIDAGHVCQNLYLAAENIGAGVCAIAAFHDEIFSEVLRIDGENHFVVYLASLGKKKD